MQNQCHKNSIMKSIKEGVEWFSLEEVFIIKGGYTPSKAKPEYWKDGTIPWFRMEDIRTNGRILSNSIQHITPKAVKRKLFPANSIIVATTATIGEHALLIVDSLANQQFTCLSTCELFKDKINMKYFFYYMFIVDEWCKKNVNSGTFNAVDMPKFKKYKFPLPPLLVQEEIVRILDKFTELQAELQARRLQYKYYRSKLLDFSNITTHPLRNMLNELCLDGVDFKGLNELLKVVGKGIRAASFENKEGKIPFYKSSPKHSFCSEADFNFEALLIGDGGEANVNYVNSPFSASDHTYIFKKKTSCVKTKFIYYFLLANIQELKDGYRGATIKNISKNYILGLLIPLPPLLVQEEIVRILDKFDALVSSLTHGLPAEIEARRLQYEYYRAKLLSFNNIHEVGG